MENKNTHLGRIISPLELEPTLVNELGIEKAIEFFREASKRDARYILLWDDDDHEIFAEYASSDSESRQKEQELGVAYLATYPVYR